jgi:uncharacterized repeat protein (TIGR03803 family)
MKKAILITLAVILNSALNAQNIELWGTTALGGSTNSGTVFKYSVQDDSLTSIPLEMPQAGVPELQGFIEASNGKLYALSRSFGFNDDCNSIQTGGVIIEFDPITNTYQDVYHFKNMIDGQNPNYKLMQASDGKLYGMTISGGTYNEGVIFRFDVSNYSYTKLFDFQNSSGSSPTGALVEGTNDVLYGTTQLGGTNQKGVLFRFELTDLNYIVAYNFNGSQGSFPSNTLIKVDNSTFVGTTSGGGTDDFGVIYKYDFMSFQYTKIHDFDLQLGMVSPRASIVFDGLNKIYGASSNDPSRIFCFNLSSETMSVLHEFDPLTDGYHPEGGLFYHNGELYGLCSAGGVNSTGTLFKYSIANDLLTVINHFTQSPTSYYMNTTIPFIASNNSFYGLGTFGGSPNLGGIFKFDLSTSQLTNLHDFNYGINGAIPKSTLFQASNGRVFGTAYYGGLSGEGVVFEVDRYTNEIETLHNAILATGNQFTDVMIEYQGKLLGTGANGTIYSIDMNTNTYSELGDISGTTASGGLVQIDDYGYGVSYFGGDNNVGTLYRFDLNNNNVSSIEFSFDGILTGASPVGHLFANDDFFLYGLTESGGTNGSGTIYKYEPFLNDFIKLYDFDNLSGNSPTGSLVKHSNGKFYGLAKYGGNNDLGVLFSFDDNTQTYEKLVDFDSLNGSIPRGSLLVASDGLLYGLTAEGGQNNDGVLFSFNTTTNQINTLFDFDRYVSGSHPFQALTEVDPILSTADKSETSLVVYPNPFQSIINLQNPKSEIVSIQVVDLYGKLLFENTSNKANISIDLSNFSSGVYTLQYDRNGFIGSTKIIKY